MIDDGEDRSWEAFERYVWEAVKAGKIGAMRLWAELHQEDRPAADDPFAEFAAQR